MVGSGAGIKAITQQTVDFGASDAAMKDADIAALPSGTKILHVPTALGAVVIIFNVPGVTSLNLDAQNVADIFLGNIKTWNDPKIAANNAGAALPNTPVLVVHRSDGSGTTNAFTSYLSAVSPDWKSQVGAGTDVKWPTGIGAKGNDGVAGGVKQNAGGVGYVELNYATQAQIPMANLKNATGTFVTPSTAGVTAAAATQASTFPADARQAPIINAPGADSYPIASYTYLLVYLDQKDATKGQALGSWPGSSPTARRPRRAWATRRSRRPSSSRRSPRSTRSRRAGPRSGPDELLVSRHHIGPALRDGGSPGPLHPGQPRV